MISRRLQITGLAALLLGAFSAPGLGQTSVQELTSADPARLVEILENPDASTFEKAKACQRLAVVGTKDAVPALASLLADEALNVYARTALERIADPAADEALREAATELKGRQLVGVVQSIGRREDERAVDLLRELLGHDDPAVVAAAARSLAEIAPSESVDALREALANAEDKAPLADAMLVGAERLATAGKTDEALRLYEAAAGPDVPAHLRADALRGKMRLLKADAKDILLEQLRSDEEIFFNLGLAMAREMPGRDVAEALLRELENLPPGKQALLLLALGDRPEPVPLTVLERALRSDSAALREAAVRVLARYESPEALAMLFEAALRDDDVAATARESLRRHPSQAVDAMVLARLKEGDSRTKVVLLELAGARRIEAAKEPVTSALDDRDEAVRLAALGALAEMITLDELPVLVARAQGAAGSTETAAARAALATAALRMSEREEAAARLAATLEGAPVDYQVSILELLGRLGGSTALATVAAGAKSDEPQIKDAATRILGEWPDAEAAPVLLEIAKTDPENRYQIRALRGYLRIARQLQLPTEKRLEMFHTAMEVARRDEERRLALDVLSRIPSAKTLELAVSYLDDPALRGAAADAATRIAPRLLDSEPKAVAAAMQKVVDAGVGGAVGERARQLLNQAQSRTP